MKDDNQGSHFTETLLTSTSPSTRWTLRSGNTARAMNQRRADRESKKKAS